VMNAYCGHTNYSCGYNLRKNILGDLLQFRSEFVSVRDFEILGMGEGE
jgi:hypothetical protein